MFSGYVIQCTLIGSIIPFTSNSAQNSRSSGLPRDVDSIENPAMSKRVGEIISKIYRPPAEKRQAMALSRGDAEQLPLLPGVAMISISGPDQAPATLPAYEHLLRLCFSDVDFLSKDLSPRAKAKIASAMTKNQAVAILDYVEALPEQTHTVIVHCAGGYSRSCGVVAALKDIYGYQVEEERLTEANQSVRRLLVESARKT